MSDLMIRLDTLKYALRNSLRLISRQIATPIPIKALSEDDYSRYIDIIKISIQYMQASKIFYSYHNGEIELSIDSEHIIYTSESPTDSRFHALEFGVSNASQGSNTFAFFVLCFVGDNVDLKDGTNVKWSTELKEIVRRSSSRKGRIRYNIITRLAKKLYNIFRDQNDLLIDKWKFPWGSMQETADFMAALSSIGLYHLVSIHQRSVIDKLDGAGVDDICYVSSPKKLHEEVSRISDLPLDKVKTLTKYFTYGHLTRTPDPVLQPLLPVDDGQIAFPSSMFLSSNWPRNILSLHARISPATFDAQSNIFESGMIEQLKEKLSPNFDVYSNIIFNTEEGREEVDLIVMQRDRSVALICELRWMLQPGDPGEVQNRLKAIRKKVSQVDRKFGRITRMPDVNPVQYLPIVIVEGYGGVQSPVPTKIPIVNMHFLTKLLEQRPDVEFIHAFLCTPSWLPKVGRDFEMEREAETLCGRLFSQTGIRPLGNTYFDVSLNEYLDEVKNLTVDELKLIRWPSS